MPEIYSLSDPERVTYFAETDARNRRVRFGIKAKDRTRHMYVIGKTGMGKSTLLENMAVQDIQKGEGMAFLDPHGKTADLLLEYVPEHRLKDVLYFAPFDMDYPVAFNVMEDVGYDKRHLVVSGLMSTFKKIWADAWSARMEYILSNTLLALLEYPGATLLAVNKMLSDKEFRKRVVDNITDPSVKSFWVDEFAKYTDRFAAEATPAIQNKIGQFTSNPLIRNIIGQPKSSFDVRKMMDERKILIINLSKGRVGETNANLLGSMLITRIYLSAMSRADVPESVLNKLPNFYLYVDEFQSFANESFADILSEARKYKLNLTMAHQYIEQMSEEVRAAVFGNVGTMAIFRVGSYDAEVLEKEFAPQFTAQDIVNLGQYQMYLKLMIDGVSSQPFSAVGMKPIDKPPLSLREILIETSRNNFARPRAEIEEDIRKLHAPAVPPQRDFEAAGPKPSSGNNQFAPRMPGPNSAFPGSRPRPAPLPQNAEVRPPLAPMKNRIQISSVESTPVAPLTPPPMPLQQKAPPRPEAVPAPMSLSSLKPIPEPVKKDNKKPSEKNLMSLREALAALNVKKDDQKKESIESNEKKIEVVKSEKTSEAVQAEEKIEKPKPPAEQSSAIKNIPHHGNHTHTPPLPPYVSKKSETETNRAEPTSNPREIPEDVLKKMLDVKKDIEESDQK